MRIATLAVMALLLAVAAPARADRAIADVDATGTGVVVRLACAMRYVAHFPARAGSEVRIDLQPLPGCSLADVGRDVMPVAPGAQTAVASVEFEMLTAGVRPTLTVRFSRPIEFELRPQPGFEAIEIRFLRRAASVQVEPSGPVPEASRPAFRPLPSNAALEREFEQARAAMLAKDYDAAIRLYTKLLEYPEHAWRARSQEYLGLARERKRQFAHAKSEYEEYLRRYPDGEGAARVQQRLAALVTLERRRGAGGPLPGDPDASPWQFTSSLAQEFRSDSLTFESGATRQDAPTVAAIVTDADLQLRRRGQRYDLQSRLNGGYLWQSRDARFDSKAPTRLSAAWLDLSDRELAWSARLGRQSRSSGGVYGLYDGLHAAWRAKPGLRLNLMTGFPRDTSRAEFDTDRRFVAASADFYGVASGLDVSAYAIEQQIAGLTDRQAVGTELRWHARGRTAIALFDYDVHYAALNAAVLQGSWQLPARWTVTGTFDHRRTPFLATRNALIGQPVRSIDALVPTFGESGLRQLAEDRTSTVDLYALGVTRPWGERLQWSLDVASVRYGDLPASGGVDAVQSAGRDLQYTMQLIGSGWWRDGDMHVAGLRHATNDLADGDSLYWALRLPVWGGLRLGPRLRYDRRTSAIDGSTFDAYGGSINGDWRFARGSLEFEAGGEWGTQQAQPAEQKTRRQWFSLGYRLFF